MIARFKSWFRFDAEALAATANALAAFSGVPVQLYDLRVNDEEPQETGVHTGLFDEALQT